MNKLTFLEESELAKDRQRWYALVTSGTQSLHAPGMKTSWLGPEEGWKNAQGARSHWRGGELAASAEGVREQLGSIQEGNAYGAVVSSQRRWIS